LTTFHASTSLSGTAPVAGTVSGTLGIAESGEEIASTPLSVGGLLTFDFEVDVGGGWDVLE